MKDAYPYGYILLEYQNLRYTADISVQERIRAVIIIQENETIAWKRPSLLISW